MIFEPAEEGGYLAHVPPLGLTTEGEPLNEVREMAKDAIAGYLEALAGIAAPVEEQEELTEPVREVVEVSVA